MAAFQLSLHHRCAVRHVALANGVQSRAQADFDPLLVKLFTPDAGATWLLSEIDPEDHDIAFGLCDLGLGFPELGFASLSDWPRCAACSGCRSRRTCISGPASA